MKYEYEYEKYLMHYGVKGMKWGVRRYQNYDGSLTTAGRNRIKQSSDKTVFDDLKSSYRITRKRGYDSCYSTVTNVGSHKNVSVNMVIHEKDMQSKTAKSKARKAQKFMTDLDEIEKTNKLKGKLEILDMDIEKDVAYATYQNGRVDYEISTHKILRKDGTISNSSLTNTKTYEDKVNSINAKYEKKYREAVKKGIPDEDIELIELEWMEEIDSIQEL